MFIVNSNLGAMQPSGDSRVDDGSKAESGSARMMDGMMTQGRGLDQASLNLSVLIRQHCPSMPSLGY
jgi:hypothetical protein